MNENNIMQEKERQNEIFYKLLYYIECDLQNSQDDISSNESNI